MELNKILPMEMTSLINSEKKGKGNSTRAWIKPTFKVHSPISIEVVHSANQETSIPSPSEELEPKGTRWGPDHLLNDGEGEVEVSDGECSLIGGSSTIKIRVWKRSEKGGGDCGLGRERRGRKRTWSWRAVMLPERLESTRSNHSLRTVAFSIPLPEDKNTGESGDGPLVIGDGPISPCLALGADPRANPKEMWSRAYNVPDVGLCANHKDVMLREC